jgi:hypothetical protein
MDRFIQFLVNIQQQLAVVLQRGDELFHFQPFDAQLLFQFIDDQLPGIQLLLLLTCCRQAAFVFFYL